MTRLALVLAIALSGCAAKNATATTKAPRPPQIIGLPNELPGFYKVCVPAGEFLNQGEACIRLEDLRKLLRSLRAS